jgi:hypothetical protein
MLFGMADCSWAVVGFRAFVRIGTVDHVLLIQIKQTAPEQGTVPQEACKRPSSVSGEHVERAASSDGARW